MNTSLTPDTVNTECIKREFTFSNTAIVNGEQAILGYNGTTPTLFVKGIKIAEINSSGVIKLENNATVKRFLNTGALNIEGVKLITKNYGQHKNVWNSLGDHKEFAADIKTFNVSFIRPLKLAKIATGDFQDAQNLGSDLALDKLIHLTDWRNKDVVIGDDQLGKFYDVQAYSAAYFDLVVSSDKQLDNNKILTNLKDDGSGNWVVDNSITESTAKVTLPIGTDVTVIQKSIDNKLVWVLNYKTNGSIVQTNYKIWIPVTVKYKWGEIKSKVEVTVKPAI